jgi:hypothetical protein
VRFSLLVVLHLKQQLTAVAHYVNSHVETADCQYELT